MVFYYSPQFFGEYSYLLGPEIIQEKDPVRFSVCADAAIVTKLSFDELDYFFHRNPVLALNFFKFLTFKYSQLYIFQIYTTHYTSPKSYLQFTQQLNRFLHQKEIRTGFTQSSSIIRQKDKTKKSTKALLSKLKVASTEVILASYPCKVKGDIRHGILVIFTDFLIIAHSIFGHISNQNRVLHENILNFQLHTDHCLEIVLENNNSIVLQLNSPQIVSEVLQLLSVLVEQNQLKIEKLQQQQQVNPAPPLFQAPSNEDSSMEFSAKEWEFIYSFGTLLELEQGDVVQEQHIPCCSLYRVRSGLFSITRTVVSHSALRDSGSQYDKNTAKSVKVAEKIVGQFFGEVGFIFGGISTATVKAVTQASCWKFSPESFNKLVLHHPVLGAKLYRALACDLLCSILDLQNLFQQG